MLDPCITDCAHFRNKAHSARVREEVDYSLRTAGPMNLLE